MTELKLKWRVTGRICIDLYTERWHDIWRRIYDDQQSALEDFDNLKQEFERDKANNVIDNYRINLEVF